MEGKEFSTMSAKEMRIYKNREANMPDEIDILKETVRTLELRIANLEKKKSK